MPPAPAPAPFRALVEAWFGPRRFNLALFGVFALTALLLAVSGIYTLMSYSVSQRRQEIGLRMAIGATEGDVLRLIFGQAARLLSAGLGVGMLLAIGARPLMSSMARGRGMDPSLAILSAGLLAAVTIVAAWLPARRAARIPPSLALHGQ
jgi:putative ABC transport system permease protein